ncbi:hypothetical protein SAPIO_CDS10763 [Scedosporium apiospermum]|uniref:DUF676 domain-containing protein n=1 Tax=Pseudallescheria apiosperma TaxID=563466 RepID=A0A084FUH4_PSEDA|nr:uncharacterized protein SAPIO_CDS10763 [Scedosporium apiospermum]KEZ38736.1 hypothetical protein SAPIO_CDS10763 [Scedosporium apiospermum]
MDYTGGKLEADHLCVLVHGLWGNPSHMRNVAKALRAKFPAEKLYLLIAKSNSGSFTSDGIELGGERVCAEIQEELHAVKSKGGNFTKLSIVGYSLGGLVARYALGLLYAKGILDGIECMSFTTFVTPHLGVRTPLKGWHNHVWNVVGARTLSMSGRQLFMVDQFRDTGRPLLSVMADPKSIFMKGLGKFRRHTAYANVVNDKSSVYYTTGISKTDPFADMAAVDVNYLDGYDEVIIDLRRPITPRPQMRPQLTLSTTSLAIFSWRIKRHEKGLTGFPIEEYRMPLWIMEAREEAERAYEALNNTHENEYLGGSSEDEVDDEGTDFGPDAEEVMSKERLLSKRAEPTLALSPRQFTMIDSLDSLGWRRYPVWIRKDDHSHAAIIVRVDKPSATEGWVVLSHWLKEEFLV